MKKLLKKLNRNSKLIQELDNQLEVINTLPYYSIFGTMQEKAKDIESCKKAKSELYTKRQTILENIQLESNKQLQFLSQLQRSNTLTQVA